jgi:GNAT superfamily N-acetyltransferase
MAALLQKISANDQLGNWITAEDIERDYQRLTNCDPEKDMLMVEDENGMLVAYARVLWQKEDGCIRFGFPFNFHPDWRSLELYQHLLGWVESHALEMASSASLEGPLFLRSFLLNIDTEPIMKQALELQGFSPVRYMNRMRRDLNEPIEVPDLPAGLEVRPAQEKEYRAIFNGLDEAFQDHWGHVPATEQDFQQFISAPVVKPALWQVAWDGEQVAAGVLNFIDEKANEQFNVQRGWTDPIFTRRSWRKRGLARILLMRSMQMFKEMGMTEVMLGVDTQNPSGAFRLYESCGFKSVMFSIVFDKELTRL